MKFVVYRELAIKNQTNAIGAIHQQCLFAVGLFDCTINSDVYHFWIEHLLSCTSSNNLRFK